MAITGFLAAVSVAALAFFLIVARADKRARRHSMAGDHGGSYDSGGNGWNFFSGSGGDTCSSSSSDSSSSCDSGGDGGGGGGD